MRGGFSSCEGIMIYDTSIDRALYAYYDHDDILVLEGTIKEISDIKTKQQLPFKRKDHLQDYIIFSLIVFYLLLCICSFILFPFLVFLSILTFCIGSYFPIIVIVFANVNMYINEEKNRQSKRYHACEHALMNIISKDNITMDDLKNSSIYESECGTVYCGYFLFLLIVICYLIVNVVSVGIFNALLIVLFVVVALFINLFNPYNPFLFIQKPTLEQPNEKEYLLVLELVKKW